MSTQISPRLRRADVMLNGFSSCISNTPEEFSGAPEMPSLKIISQPRMLPHQLESTIPFEQLQCFAYRHCWRQLNKQMHMIDSDIQFVNLAFVFDCNFSDESFAVNFNSEKLEGVHCIFGFPNQVESILPEGVTETLQIHFFAPKNSAQDKAHAKSVNLFQEGVLDPLYFNKYQELNFEGGNSSVCLKAEVSLPLM